MSCILSEQPGGHPRPKEALILRLRMVNPKPAMPGHLAYESGRGKATWMATQTERVRVAPWWRDWIMGLLECSVEEWLRLQIPGSGKTEP